MCVSVCHLSLSRLITSLLRTPVAVSHFLWKIRNIYLEYEQYFFGL